MLKTFPSLLAGSALVALAADGALGAEGGTSTPTPTPPNPVAEFEFTQLEGKHSLDMSGIPANVRMDFLQSAVRAYIANRLKSVGNRHAQDPAVAAWAAYDAATEADPLQSTVAKPEGERPAGPNYQEAYDRAVADLRAGNVRRQSDEPKARKTADPLTRVVTEVVLREVFEARRAADPKYTFVKAKAEVGSDGIAYLNKLIDAKVEGGADRKALETMREEKYLKPARAMLGLDTSKKVGELPSIL